MENKLGEKENKLSLYFLAIQEFILNKLWEII